MIPLNCAIIEDEPLGAKSLQSMIHNNHPEFIIKRFARTLAEAKEVFSDKSIGLFFTDIELVDGNIFEVLKEIELLKGQYIVFTTAYEEFGVKAFSYPALHYLMKPIHPEELAKAIKRFKELALNVASQDDKTNESDFVTEMGLNKLVLPTQNGTTFIDLSSIIRIQATNKYSIVFTTDRKQHIVVKTLSRFEALLSEKGFIRIHDSHIVNIHLISRYVKGRTGEIVMSDDSHVPISSRRKEALSKILKNIL